MSAGCQGHLGHATHLLHAGPASRLPRTIFPNNDQRAGKAKNFRYRKNAPKAFIAKAAITIVARTRGRITRIPSKSLRFNFPVTVHALPVSIDRFAAVGYVLAS